MLVRRTSRSFRESEQAFIEPMLGAARRRQEYAGSSESRDMERLMSWSNGAVAPQEGIRRHASRRPSLGEVQYSVGGATQKPMEDRYCKGGLGVETTCSVVNDLRRRDLPAGLLKASQSSGACKLHPHGLPFRVPSHQPSNSPPHPSLPAVSPRRAADEALTR
jgi:hypothetical protein